MKSSMDATQRETKATFLKMVRHSFRFKPSETGLGVEVIPSDRSMICQKRVMLMGFQQVSVSNQDSDRF